MEFDRENPEDIGNLVLMYSENHRRISAIEAWIKEIQPKIETLAGTLSDSPATVKSAGDSLVISVRKLEIPFDMLETLTKNTDELRSLTEDNKCLAKHIKAARLHNVVSVDEG